MKKAFEDMKASAKAQHETDQAEFEIAKAGAKADFDENKDHNTFAKAKADAKKSRDDVHMSPAQRAEKAQFSLGLGAVGNVVLNKNRHSIIVFKPDNARKS